MDIIKNLEPSMVALLRDLHKPYSVYNNLKELANLPNDPKSRNLFLIYKFFVAELAENGQLADDKIDETVHDCIMWFVSNPRSDNENKFLNKFMYNLLVMTRLIDNKPNDKTNPEPEENDEDTEDSDDMSEEDLSEDGDEIYGGPFIDLENSDDEPDDLYEDEGVNNDDDEYDISEDDDIIEDEDDDFENIFEDEDDVEPDEEATVNPVDIDASALARCYQCKNLVDNSTCRVEDKSIKVLCSSSYNWEHPCPNFEYSSIKKGTK